MTTAAELWTRLDTLPRPTLGELFSAVRDGGEGTDEPGGAERVELLAVALLDERLRFINRQRIEATQYEILRRLRGSDSGAPVSPPFLSALYLAARDPVESVEFYRKLFNIEPQHTSRRARGFAEFELPGFTLVIHGLDQQSAEDPYELGPRPQSLGWGALFVLAVSDLDRCVENARSNGIELLDSDLEGRKPASAETAGVLPGRFILVKDPSGYLVELEERP